MAGELRDWRKQLHLTQAGAAKSLGVPYATFRGWEGGRAPVLPDTVRILMGFIEREAADRPVPAIEPGATEGPIHPADAPVMAAQRIAQTLSRSDVQPFFRQSGKGRPK